MRTIDLSPLYRSMIGFDRVADLIDAATRLDGGPGYPPFNVEDIGEESYRVELAVAGFAEADLAVEVTDGTLTIRGRKEDEAERRYLHRGIASRAFERRFKLADHVIVTGAKLQNGLLSVDLRRETPEAKRPRRIEIQAKDAGRLIQDDAA